MGNTCRGSKAVPVPAEHEHVFFEHVAIGLEPVPVGRGRRSGTGATPRGQTRGSITDGTDVIDMVQRSVIGRDAVINTPFGPRVLT